MKKLLALGLAAGMLAVGFSSLSPAPAEACRNFSNQDRRAQARAFRRYQQEMAWQQYQNQYPANLYTGAQYPYPLNSYPASYNGYYPPSLDYASYYPQSGYSPYNPGLLNAGLNSGLGGGLVQGLLNMF